MIISNASSALSFCPSSDVGVEPELHVINRRGLGLVRGHRLVGLALPLEDRRLEQSRPGEIRVLLEAGVDRDERLIEIFLLHLEICQHVMPLGIVGRVGQHVVDFRAGPLQFAALDQLDDFTRSHQRGSGSERSSARRRLGQYQIVLDRIRVADVELGQRASRLDKAFLVHFEATVGVLDLDVDLRDAHPFGGDYNSVGTAPHHRKVVVAFLLRLGFERSLTALDRFHTDHYVLERVPLVIQDIAGDLRRLRRERSKQQRSDETEADPGCFGHCSTLATVWVSRLGKLEFHLVGDACAASSGQCSLTPAS
jgi:hypothetical protein